MRNPRKTRVPLLVAGLASLACAASLTTPALAAPTVGVAGVAQPAAVTTTPTPTADPSPAAPTPQSSTQSPSTTALSGPSSAVVGSTQTLSATVSGTDPSTGASTPVPGVSVSFYRQTATGPVLVGSTATDASGVAQMPVKIGGVSQSYTASWPGSTSYAPSTSQPLSVTGTPRPTSLSITGPASFVDETSATLHIRWVSGSPAVGVAGKVNVYSRLIGGTWRLTKTVSVPSSGLASMVVSPRNTTQWQARAAATPTTQAASSTIIKLVNKPPMAPVYYPPNAPKPAWLPAQQRAVGAGANATVSRIPNAVWDKMVGVSWRPGCPVGRSGLRLFQVNYWGFDGYRHRGQIIVNADVASNFVGAFSALYRGQYPIRAMYLPDRFGYSARSHGANDFAAMDHDDTDAFNCRWVSGNPGVLSPHALGRSVDINSFENPYSSYVGYLPDSWWMPVHRPRITYRSNANPVVSIMRWYGFRWTYGLTDTQHFDAIPGAARMAPAARVSAATVSPLAQAMHLAAPND